MESRRDRIHQDVSRVDFLAVTASQTLAAINRVVEADSVGGAIALALCPPDQMKGLTVAIKMVGTDAGDVTITSTSKYYDGTVTLTAVGFGALMYSDGTTWWQIATLTV